MLCSHYTKDLTEAGCDEAGRGCLAGPVFAAAVILPRDFRNELLNDSKKLTVRQRNHLRPLIEAESLAWAVACVEAPVIDDINILNATFLAMHQAIRQLKIPPRLLLIDGNRFKSVDDIPYICIVKGDGKFQSIAAASVLAKTHRDEFMEKMHQVYPWYDWDHNKGYPCKKHRQGIALHGITPLHRKSFRLQEL